ncbi:hypothetical protein B0H21DRAFT_672644, partial [Amylocystis lapponica]
AVFRALSDVKWSLGDFLFHVFRFKDDNGQSIEHDRSHAASIQHFLHGHTKHTPATIIDLWFHHPDGQYARTDDEEPMYSITPAFTEMKLIRPALTAFAAQTVLHKLLDEAEEAIEPRNDVGAATVPRVADIMREHQPLTWKYFLALAQRDHKKPSDAVRITRRPPDVVCVVVHAIGSLNFSCSNRANILPLARGLLYFSLSAPFDLFLYNSRIGATTAYTTVYRAMEALALHEAALLKAHGQDPRSFGVIWMDNVQNYLLQRDPRLGRENTLNIGIAATYVEAPYADPKAFDVEDKRRRLAEGRRKDLTVEDLIGFIDQNHREVVGSLQWLRTLVHYVPELTKYRDHVSMLYKTRGAKRRLPEEPSKVHPFATSGMNETIITEIKNASLDFREQLGQTRDNHVDTIQIIGGDGLTYAQLGTLKNDLQFHDNEFDRFSAFEPVLALWHTGWTDLSRLVETHWGSLLSKDPSTLGHSALKISRRTPPNLKKVEYNSGAEMVYLILDARLLDCWRIHFKTTHLLDYFTRLASENKLPEIEDLERAALKLYRAYSSFRAAERAMYPVDANGPTLSAWEETVPLGSPWTAPSSTTPPEPTQNKPKRKRTADVTAESAMAQPSTQTGENTSKPTRRQAKKNDAASIPPEPFKGDRVLYHSIVFIRDGVVSREFAYAMAEGDVGRAYEALKIMLFTFAGSTHTKYTSYLLETIANLELESSPALRDAILDSLLVNLTGRPGHFMAGDLMQEHFNRLLQAIAERKGTEYSNHFLRDVVSRNLHHMARLQHDMKEGVGLSRCSGHHLNPKAVAELKILDHEYQEHELHSRRPGRTF